MQYAVALLALVASVSAQTATGTPPQCTTSFSKSFQIANVNVSSSDSKRDLEQNLAKRDVVCNTEPIIELKDGTLTDQAGSTGEVVGNHQFQFDNPLQDPRIYTSGFSVCANDTLALGSSAIFWACNSGNFSNLYDITLSDDESSIYDPAVCYQVYLQVLPCGSVQISSAPSLSASTGSAKVASTMATSAPAVSAVTTSSAMTTSSLAGPAVYTSTPVAAPYPVANTTVPVGTASASAPGSASTSPLTAPASGASALTIGSTVGALAAAFVALALL